MGNNPLKAMRILLIDDDKDVRDTIKLVLRMDRHEVVEAAEGRQGLELLNDGQFDLVITDYVMPEMSGDLLAAEVKRINPATPVIMITANADLLPNMLSGVDRILSKPFEVNELIKMIRDVAGLSPLAE